MTDAERWYANPLVIERAIRERVRLRVYVEEVES